MPLPMLIGTGRVLLGAPVFSPAALASLKLWLKADGTLWQNSARSTPAVADADPVGAWDDLSSNAFHMTQATGVNRPTLKLNILNGKPIIRFNGTSNILTNSGAIGLANNTTFFFVFIPSSTSPSGLFDGGQSNANVIRNLGNFAGEFEIHDKNPTVLMSLANTNPVLISFTTSIPANRQLVMYKNGTLLATGNGAVATAITWATVGIGGINNGGTAWYGGDIAEVIAYGGVLAAADMTSVHNYLNARWKIY